MMRHVMKLNLIFVTAGPKLHDKNSAELADETCTYVYWSAVEALGVTFCLKNNGFQWKNLSAMIVTDTTYFKLIGQITM